MTVNHDVTRYKVQSEGKKKDRTRRSLFLGSPNWARTSDIMINSHALYRLSYRGISVLVFTFFVTVMRTSLHLRIVKMRTNHRLASFFLALGGFASSKTVHRTLFNSLRLSYHGISVK